MTVGEFISTLKSLKRDYFSQLLVRDNGRTYSAIYDGIVRSVDEILINQDLYDKRGYVCAKYVQNGMAQLYTTESPALGDLCVSCISNEGAVVIIDVRCRG